MSDPILYTETDRSTWLTTPSVVRYRAIYKGPRESYKINEEINAFLYDIRRITEVQGEARANLETYITSLLDGGETLEGSTNPIIKETSTQFLTYNSDVEYDSDTPYQGG